MSGETHRRSNFNLAWSIIIGWGGLFGILNSYYRLKGLTDNGLKWRRPDKKLRKYDFTSEYEKGTIWRYLRIRD
jgi:hypothetical protein